MAYRRRRPQYYLGRLHGHTGRQVFKATSTPTHAEYGSRYASVVGPFRTRRAAVWAALTAPNNPHFQHVADAERIARRLAERM